MLSFLLHANVSPVTVLQASKLAEMSQGLGINEDSESSDSDMDDNGEDYRISVNPPTTRDKMKTKRQKRKRKERLKEVMTNNSVFMSVHYYICVLSC